MNDAIAEPARLELYPGYGDARARAYEAGAFGVSISGAGPSVVAIVPRGSEEAVGRALEGGYEQGGIAARAHAATVDREGARVVP
jgi:homoserine kinase